MAERHGVWKRQPQSVSSRRSGSASAGSSGMRPIRSTVNGSSEASPLAGPTLAAPAGPEGSMPLACISARMVST